MCDILRLFQVASETTRNGSYKWSEKSEGYVFIPTIVEQNVKKTHPAGLENSWRIPQYRNSRLKLPKYRMKNWPIPQFKIKITEIPHEKLANAAIQD